MSRRSTRIFCTGCSFEALDGHGPKRIIYIERNGKKIHHTRTNGWCYECDNYVDMEDINPSRIKESLENNKEEHKVLTEKLHKKFIGRKSIKEDIKHFEEQIDNQTALLTYFSNRSTGARCLKCGSDNTMPLVFSESDHFAHNFKHKCGGQLSNEIDKSQPQFRQHIPLSTYIFDSNGDLIDKQ